LTQKDKTPTPSISVSGSGNTLIFPFNNAETETTETSTVLIQNTWYQGKMAQHGWWYWTLHAIIAFGVALLATFVWERWLTHLFH
jgi:hypothetical protein